MSAFTALVLGGARSGKSAFAESLVLRLGAAADYLATAEAGDDEMAARIAEHQSRRGAQWRTVAEPLAICAALRDYDERPMLIDCLTLWLSNLLMAERDIDSETESLIRAVHGRRAPVVMVSNEVGMGLSPMNALGRAFRDAQGRLNQRIAAACDCAVFVAAGLPLTLKGRLPE